MRGPESEPTAKKKWWMFITEDSRPRKSWTRSGFELDSITPPATPTKAIQTRLAQSQPENAKQEKTEPDHQRSRGEHPTFFQRVRERASRKDRQRIAQLEEGGEGSGLEKVQAKGRADSRQGRPEKSARHSQQPLAEKGPQGDPLLALTRRWIDHPRIPSSVPRPHHDKPVNAGIFPHLRGTRQARTATPTCGYAWIPTRTSISAEPSGDLRRGYPCL